MEGRSVFDDHNKTGYDSTSIHSTASAATSTTSSQRKATAAELTDNSVVSNRNWSQYQQINSDTQYHQPSLRHFKTKPNRPRQAPSSQQTQKPNQSNNRDKKSEGGRGRQTRIERDNSEELNVQPTRNRSRKRIYCYL